MTPSPLRRGIEKVRRVLRLPKAYLVKNPAARARRKAIRWSYANAFVWALGNGFVGTPLISYLALALGAKGLEVGWILAAPTFAGLLRLGAPALMQAFGRRRRYVVVNYVLSSIALAVLSISVFPTTEEARPRTLTLLVVLWSLYHVLEYLGTVGMWTWLGDLTPARLRGRFLGRREWYLLVGRAVGMAFAGEFVAEYQLRHPDYPAWIAFALPARVGAFFILIAALLLAFMPAFERPAVKAASIPWKSIAAALTDRRYWSLLSYNVWSSFFNGITSVAQNVFVAQHLGLELRLRLFFEGGMRIGQVALATETGRWVDRFGNKRVMVVSQSLVAAALAFFFLANAGERWFWPAGAWVFWIAFVGLNVALPNVMLRLAPRREAAGYVAVNHTLSGLCAGLSMLAGGWLFDLLAPRLTVDAAASFTGLRQLLDATGLSRYQALFLFGMLARAAGVFWILRIDDRPAERGVPDAPARPEPPA